MSVDRVEIIVAVDNNGGFGLNGQIPWKSEPFAKVDFKNFQKITKHHECVMGRRTYEEIAEGRKGKKELLTDRKCYVVTSTPIEDDRIVVVPSLGRAMEQCSEGKKLFVLGGERLFREAMAWCDIVHMTIIMEREYECDVTFPYWYVHKNFSISNESKRLVDDVVYVKYVRPLK